MMSVCSRRSHWKFASALKKMAGLKVVSRSGIFFKALANFQWDRLLQTNIISREYLDGCYALGQEYPDLCSSIVLICERGDGAIYAK